MFIVCLILHSVPYPLDYLTKLSSLYWLCNAYFVFISFIYYPDFNAICLMRIALNECYIGVNFCHARDLHIV